MENSPDAKAAKISAFIKDLRIYQKNARAMMADGLPANVAASMDKLVKAGKLTQDQANLVKSANKSNMFGTFLDVLQKADPNNSTEETKDPMSTLLDGLKANDDTEENNSSLLDTFMSLMPESPLAAQLSAPNKTDDNELQRYDLLESLLKEDVLLNGKAMQSRDKGNSMDSALYDALTGLIPDKNTMPKS